MHCYKLDGIYFYNILKLLLVFVFHNSQSNGALNCCHCFLHLKYICRWYQSQILRLSLNRNPLILCLVTLYHICVLVFAEPSHSIIDYNAVAWLYCACVFGLVSWAFQNKDFLNFTITNDSHPQKRSHEIK